jgi:hypothetical protein
MLDRIKAAVAYIPILGIPFLGAMDQEVNGRSLLVLRHAELAIVWQIFVIKLSAASVVGYLAAEIFLYGATFGGGRPPSGYGSADYFDPTPLLTSLHGILTYGSGGIVVVGSLSGVTAALVGWLPPEPKPWLRRRMKWRA